LYYRAPDGLTDEEWAVTRRVCCADRNASDTYIRQALTGELNQIQAHHTAKEISDVFSFPVRRGRLVLLQRRGMIASFGLAGWIMGRFGR
jgi:hypothetical protein